MILELVLGAIFFTIFTHFRGLRKLKNYPPGPLSLPFVGAFPVLALAGDFGMATKLIEYGEKFGKIFALDLGSYRCVMINSSELIKEAFGNTAAAGRPRMGTVKSLCGGNFRGIALQDGPAWREHRQFTVKNLKDFGFGKKSLGPIIAEEARELVKTLKSMTNQPLSFQHAFNITVVNILWTIIAGERFGQDDPKLLELVSVISDATSQSDKLGIFFFPRLAAVLPALSGWNRFKQTALALHVFAQELIDTVRKTYTPGIQRHFTDVYLDELEKRRLDVGSSFAGSIGEENMKVVLVDLFFAGSETTSTTLSWAMLYLALHPAVQEKVFVEVDEVIGDHLPSLDHRQSMTYTEAVIMETLRCSSVTQIGIAHRALEDLEIGGYLIPKETLLFSNIYAAHHDPSAWKEPQLFKPERFLSSDGKKIVKQNAFLPFSVGKRSCPGETLAKDEIFIILTSILQRFRVELDSFSPHPPMNAKFSTTRSPVPHTLVLRERC